MKTVFLLLLGIIYLFLANAMEAILIKKTYFLIGIALVTVGTIRYIKWKYHTYKLMTELKRASEEELNNIPHTHSTIASNGLQALLLNEHTKTLLVAMKEDWEAELTKKEVQFNEIYEVAIMEDGHIIARTSNGLFNESLLEEDHRSLGEEEDMDEDESEEIEEISHLAIKLVVDNITAPIIEYAFLELEDAISKEDDSYLEAMELCEQWFQKISIIIKRYELERVPIRRWQ
ncbi:hypothetical protein FH508_0020950 [Lysinibacillus sp. CD3-6]|uniref:hypothetical protein n=1 Tax=Lysinibacillus sp. CD3-6 TaxID=2892541 RepID=UPI00116B52C5|nr:hypothetical protein [Lysinibacillus sp. CD3-6]UED79821.1 hypothetical protein FH508_0020950 [Lysinibacillus sp. CD3-6]